MVLLSCETKKEAEIQLEEFKEIFPLAKTTEIEVIWNKFVVWYTVSQFNKHYKGQNYTIWKGKESLTYS